MKSYEKRIAAGLVTRGWEETEGVSKYRVFRASHTTAKLFVGKNGALRIGHSATESRSIGNPKGQTHLYSNILADGDKVLRG